MSGVTLVLLISVWHSIPLLLLQSWLCLDLPSLETKGLGRSGGDTHTPLVLGQRPSTSQPTLTTARRCNLTTTSLPLLTSTHWQVGFTPTLTDFPPGWGCRLWNLGPGLLFPWSHMQIHLPFQDHLLQVTSVRLLHRAGWLPLNSIRTVNGLFPCLCFVSFYLTLT